MADFIERMPPMSFEGIIFLILLFSAIFGALKGGVRMVRPVVAFIMARVLLPFFQGILGGPLFRNIFYTAVEGVVGELTEVPAIGNFIDGTVDNICSSLGFIISLIVCNIILSVVFYKITPKGLILGTANALIGAVLNLIVTILIMGAVFRLGSATASLFPLSSAITDKMEHSGLSKGAIGISNIIFDTVKVELSED